MWKPVGDGFCLLPSELSGSALQTTAYGGKEQGNCLDSSDVLQPQIQEYQRRL